jgi:uncharacterized protein (DUF58 family)
MNLGGRALVLLAAIGLLAVSGRWAGSGWEALWIAPLLLLVLLLALERRLTRRRPLRVERLLPERAELARPLSLRYRIDTGRAHTRLRWAEAGNAVVAGALFDFDRCADRAGVVEAEATVLIQSLGRLELEGGRAARLGVFGLAWWPEALPGRAAVRVVPQRLAAVERRAYNRDRGAFARTRQGLGSDVFGLREYRPGDALKQIDWKATARSTRPMVRVYAQEQSLEVAVLLDLGRASLRRIGPLARAQYWINLAARLGQLALNDGDVVHVLAYSSTILVQAWHLRGPSGVLRLRGALEALQPSASASNLGLAASAVMRQLPRRTLLVWLTDVDGPLAADALLRAVRTSAHKHVSLLAAIEDPALLQLAAEPGRDWRAPFRALAAEDVLAAERRTWARLRELGARVVAAPPEHLDDQLLRAFRVLRERRAL